MVYPSTYSRSAAVVTAELGLLLSPEVLQPLIKIMRGSKYDCVAEEVNKHARLSSVTFCIGTSFGEFCCRDEDTVICLHSSLKCELGNVSHFLPPGHYCHPSNEPSILREYQCKSWMKGAIARMHVHFTPLHTHSFFSR